MKEEFDRIYNGPRRHGSAGGNMQDIWASDTEQAFAKGRSLYKEGRSMAYVNSLGRKKPKEWLKALVEGYRWQQRRAK